MLAPMGSREIVILPHIFHILDKWPKLRMSCPKKNNSKMTTLPRFLHIFDTHHSGNMLCPKIRGLVFVNTPTFFTHFGWSVAVVHVLFFCARKCARKKFDLIFVNPPTFFAYFWWSGECCARKFVLGPFWPEAHREGIPEDGTERAYRELTPSPPPNFWKVGCPCSAIES